MKILSKNVNELQMRKIQKKKKNRKCIMLFQRKKTERGENQ